jgi:hypothetical protein
VNLNATITSGGIDSAAYLVAAKFSPQKTAAKINEISVTTAALLLASVMPGSLPARARIGSKPEFCGLGVVPTLESHLTKGSSRVDRILVADDNQNLIDLRRRERQRKGQHCWY